MIWWGVEIEIERIGGMNHEPYKVELVDAELWSMCVYGSHWLFISGQGVCNLNVMNSLSILFMFY